MRIRMPEPKILLTTLFLLLFPDTIPPECTLVAVVVLLMLNRPQSVLENGDVIGGLLLTKLGLGVDRVLGPLLLSTSLGTATGFFFEESDDRSVSGSALALRKLPS